MSIAGPRGPPPPPPSASASQRSALKRTSTPSILITDTRSSPQHPQQTPSRPAQPQRQNTRIISVDHVLQYASEIPSAQKRRNPLEGERPAKHTRTPSGRHPLEPKLRGVGVPVSGTGGVGLGGAHLPARSSKTSEKLVLLPETNEEKEGGRGGSFGAAEEEEGGAPPSDEVLARRREGKGKSEAERLNKSQRQADAQLARVTAYCTAQSYRLRSTAEFVREQHGARTKIYEDCLYCVYQLPLLGGSEGFRIRSSPVVKKPGGRSVLDEQIEANERRDYREGWLEDSDEYSVRAEVAEAKGIDEEERQRREGERERSNRWKDGVPSTSSTKNDGPEGDGHARSGSDAADGTSNFSDPSPQPSISPNAETVAELFIFSYGVAVLWNFTPNQEKDILADLTFSSEHATTAASLAPLKSSRQPTQNLSLKAAALAPPTPSLPLMTRPLDEDDFETEEFHFQYDSSAEKPRIYNDMITLRTSDHMIKLAMSHAIAQSTKLSFFEERMQRTMSEAQYVPRRLALEGRLGMSRKEVVSLVGRLFEGRVDVNLSSNILSSPPFFWTSEPTLHPLYSAVREYLEIKPRIQVLNERCRVFLDLAEILSDSIADVKMTRITWIIIVLIVLSILVTCTEVGLRFGILAARGKGGGEGKAMLEMVTGEL